MGNLIHPTKFSGLKSAKYPCFQGYFEERFQMPHELFCGSSSSRGVREHSACVQARTLSLLHLHAFASMRSQSHALKPQRRVTLQCTTPSASAVPHESGDTLPQDA